MKIKDRLVKMLGGYTKDEYMCFASKPVQYKVETRTINTFVCRKMIPYEQVMNDLQCEKFVKEDIAREIMKKVIDEGYVRFSSSEKDRCFMVEGKLDAVRRYYD